MRPFQGILAVSLAFGLLQPLACYAESSSSSLSVTAKVVNSCLLTIYDRGMGIYDSSTTLLARTEEVLNVDCELETHFDQRVELTREPNGDVGTVLGQFPHQLLEGSMADRLYSKTSGRVENFSPVPPATADAADSELNEIILLPPLETASAPHMGSTLRAIVEF